MKTPTKPDTRPLCTRASLATELRLVLCAGDTVLVHSSLSKVGWVCGGAEALVRALLDVVRDSGTLVVPTHTSENSDPTEWCAPPVPESWWPTIRGSMLAFDPAQSRTRQMGVVPETVRGCGDATQCPPADLLRSRGLARPGHHQWARARQHDGRRESAGAFRGGGGRQGDADWRELGQVHSVPPCGEPASTPRKANSFAAMVDGNRQWVTVEDMEADSDDFEGLGGAFEAQTGAVTRFMIGAAETRVFLMSEALEFAEKWLLKHRAK